MGTDVAEVAEALPCEYSFKVHCSMCIELKNLVDRIAEIFPQIEAFRPRFSQGIQVLCLLNSAIEKAKQLLQYCCVGSKLYLAITGNVIVSKFQRSRNLLAQSLSRIQTMVPVILAAEISRIIDDHGVAVFMLDPYEEEAGKVMRELLQLGSSASGSVESHEIRALQFSASKLQITSQKAILIENRSIRKLLVQVGNNDPTKKKILKYLLYLLKKYGKLIMEEQSEKPNSLQEESYAVIESRNNFVNGQSIEVESNVGYQQHQCDIDMLPRATTPEEFKCPISMRLMYDPVVIASGQTFERMWIDKWFEEGNDICPKTKVKLVHCTWFPNTTMKDLIAKWCVKYGITIPDPSMQAFQSFDISNGSVASLGNSMNDLHLPLDISNISLGSLDVSYSSDSKHSKVANGSNSTMTQKKDGLQTDSYLSLNEMDFGSLSRLAELPWQLQREVVEAVNFHLQNDQACHSKKSEKFIDPLLIFLRDACDQGDVRAQRAGCQLLLTLFSRDRSGISYLHEDAFVLLTSFLDSEVIDEALAILEVLSGHPYCRSKITSSGAIVFLLSTLNSESKELQELAFKVLHNLSSSSDFCSHFLCLECIPILVPFMKDGNLAKYCIALLKNLCDFEEARVSVAKTNGCIASIAELLESGSHEEQENAVAVLLSLCSQRVQYCHLVMAEGVVPSLVQISNNGNEKGKVIALELLRQLRDVQYEDYQEGFGSDPDAIRDVIHHSKAKKSSSKSAGFFKKNFPVFSKPSSLSSKQER